MKVLKGYNLFPEMVWVVGLFLIWYGFIVCWMLPMYYSSLSSRVLLKMDLSNNKFFFQKKFFIYNMDDLLSLKDKSIFKPMMDKNYVYGYSGMGQDYFMLTAQMKYVEDMMDKEVMKVYMQFKDFFLMKGYDEKIYIFDNYFFNKLFKSNINELMVKAMKNEKFSMFREKLIDCMLKEPMKFNLYNENISIGFKFNNVFFGINFTDMLMKQYIYNFPDMLPGYNMVHIWMFKDIILMDDSIYNCLYIYKNIFTLQTMKDKKLFYFELIDLMNMDYEKYNINNLRMLDKKDS